MLAKELLTKIKNIQLKAGYLTTGSMLGEYSSAFRGLGQEFDRVREYMPGDDVRTIDWNVTARMQAPYVKVHREEREMTMMLMIDVSPSQGFGTSGRFKQEAAAELAAILAFLAIKNNDKVGLIVFSDHIEHFIKPQKGRAHVWNIIRTVLSHKSRGKTTNLAEALAFLMQVCKRKCMCFLMSDFEAAPFQHELKLAAKRHDLICTLISDPRENLLPACGLIALQDAESGELIYCDSSNPNVQELLKDRAAQEREAFDKFLKKHRIDSFALSTASSVVDPLLRYLKQREKRRVWS